MANEHDDVRVKADAIAAIAQTAGRVTIETVLDRRAEIVKLDFSEIEKLSKIIGSGTVASNFCCNGF